MIRALLFWLGMWRPEMTPRTQSYDDKQFAAQRVVCARCGLTFDMTAPAEMCSRCRAIVARDEWLQPHREAK